MLRPGLAVAVIVLVLDQLTKWLVFETLTGRSFLAALEGAPPRVPGIEITGFLNLVTVWNFGVSFGMFNSGSPEGSSIFIALAGAITVVLVAWLARVETVWLALGLGLVIGGAVGNVLDRLRFGAVFDFLDFHVLGWHWPSFNVADSGISIGVFLLLLDALFAPRPSGK
jgi:signal peptidase II